MTIRVIQDNVLKGHAQALFVTASTEPPPRGKPATDVLGGVGCQLLRHITPEAAEDLAGQLEVPVRPGSVQILELETGSGVAFEHVFVLGALSHLPGAPHKAIITAALAEGFRTARERKVARVALAVPTGGWRLQRIDALAALAIASEPFPDLYVALYCIDPQEVGEAEAVLRSFGVLADGSR